MDQRKTSGDVPPATVGSTITVIGKTLYVIAGRLVATRRMTPHIFALDLDTYIWTKVAINGAAQPTARYFHSANAFGDLIVIFGGMSVLPDTVDSLCILDDIAIFDTKRRTWSIDNKFTTESERRPKPRYAHLSTISAGRLIIAGGQELKNDYLEDAAIFDLHNRTWIGTYPISKQCGAYRSMMVSSDQPTSDISTYDTESYLQRTEDIKQNISVSPISTRSLDRPKVHPSTSNDTEQSGPQAAVTATAAAVVETSTYRSDLRKRSEDGALDLPDRASIMAPSKPIYMYSNFNFTDVQRELLTVEAPIDNGLQLQICAAAMQGSLLPPGLRFPSGTVVGDHMLVYGTYLSNSSQTFSIWALDLTTYAWSRCDPGVKLASGSWNKAVYCASKGSFIIVGNHDRSLVDDYNHRQCNFDHVTALDLEMFGIVSSSESKMSREAQELGLSAMREPLLCETDIVTAERTVIPVSSKIIGTKWPAFFDILCAPIGSANQTPQKSASQKATEDPRPHSLGSSNTRLSNLSNAATLLSEAISRSRCVYMPYSHALVHAFVRFLYTDMLPAAFEQAVSRVCPLLLFCASLEDSKTNPHLIRLMKLCRDCLHRLLSIENAAYIYETATMIGQRGLQVRALTMMVTAKKENAMHELANSAEVE